MNQVVGLVSSVLTVVVLAVLVFLLRRWHYAGLAIVAMQQKQIRLLSERVEKLEEAIQGRPWNPYS